MLQLDDTTGGENFEVAAADVLFVAREDGAAARPVPQLPRVSYALALRGYYTSLDTIATALCDIANLRIARKLPVVDGERSAIAWGHANAVSMVATGSWHIRNDTAPRFATRRVGAASHRRPGVWNAFRRRGPREHAWVTPQCRA